MHGIFRKHSLGPGTVQIRYRTVSLTLGTGSIGGISSATLARAPLRSHTQFEETRERRLSRRRTRLLAHTLGSQPAPRLARFAPFRDDHPIDSENEVNASSAENRSELRDCFRTSVFGGPPCSPAKSASRVVDTCARPSVAAHRDSVSSAQAIGISRVNSFTPLPLRRKPPPAAW